MSSVRTEYYCWVYKETRATLRRDTCADARGDLEQLQMDGELHRVIDTDDRKLAEFHVSEGWSNQEWNDEDARRGMAWWNGMTDMQRQYWADRAGTGIAADAWRLYKLGDGDESRRAR